ncbi:MAG: amino acid adenylation domain-containing protein [Pirellulaceae bacterium]
MIDLDTAHSLEGLCQFWAQETPEAPAVEDGTGRQLSYRQLNQMADQVAARLMDHGVRPGDRVGVCSPKSFDSVVAILAALKARAAYVPMDYSAPVERNRFIAKNCRMRAVCLDETRQATLELDASDVATLVFPAEACERAGRAWLSAEPSHSPPIEPAAPEDLAYILYTSGSTGVPKGVSHTHSSAMSFVRWAASTFSPISTDRFSSHAPFHFDLSIFDLYVPMTVGACVVLVSEAVGKEPRRLARFIAENKISIWYSVPSVLSILTQFGNLPEYDYSGLRLVLFAGEVFAVKHLRALKSQWPDKEFFNLYGPTETNVCTYFRIPDQIDEAREAPYPIGRPCENVKALVLDEQNQPVGAGQEGELHIHASGPVMRQYWELPEQSRGAFHVDEAGLKWYRTGDIVSLDSEGNFEFVGRRDRMVKRHGYRIELGEIETALYQHPEVREAAVVASQTDEVMQIRAFLSTKTNDPISIISLKKFCAEHLPYYMSPDQFLFVASLPRTSTDKVDYQALLKET